MNRVNFRSGKNRVRSLMRGAKSFVAKSARVVRRNDLQTLTARGLSSPSLRKALFGGGAVSLLAGAAVPQIGPRTKMVGQVFGALGAVGLFGSIALLERQVLWTTTSNLRRAVSQGDAVEDQLAAFRKGVQEDFKRSLTKTQAVKTSGGRNEDRVSFAKSAKVPSVLLPLGDELLAIGEKSVLVILPEDQIPECAEFFKEFGLDSPHYVALETDEVQQDVGQYEEIIICLKEAESSEVSSILPAAWINKSARVRVVHNHGDSLDAIENLNCSTGTHFSKLPTKDSQITELVRVRHLR